jgi:lysophospholipase L1-like esterase
VALGVGLLTLALAEGALRATQGLRNDPSYRYDARLGWSPRPGFVGRSDGTTVTITPDGWRSNGLVAPVLAVGDSFTFGTDVLDQETWPAQLERLIGRPVINGGVGGYGLDQAVLRAEDLVARLHPSLLIVAFIPDDADRCGLRERADAKPWFTASGDLRGVPVPRPLELLRLGRRAAGWRPAPSGEDAAAVSRLLAARVGRLGVPWVALALGHPGSATAPAEPFLKGARRAGARVVDLRQELDRSPRLFTRTMHPDRRGQELIARAVAEALP